MLRETFAHDLRKLQDEVLRTSSEVEANLTAVATAFLQRNHHQAQQLIKADEWVNQMRIDIGMKSLRLIATQQPIAGDMRLLATTFEIIGELERIHDYVKGIAKISLMIGDEYIPEHLMQNMPTMANKTQKMLHNAIDAFSKSDAVLAQQIPKQDDEVDQLYYQSYQAIIKFVMENPEKMEKANWIEWACHNLERTADRVINICEWVVYMETGVYEEMS